MTTSLLIDQIWELNPQVFRELKGRLNLKTITITAIASLVSQLVVFLYYQIRLPVYNPLIESSPHNFYCTGDSNYSSGRYALAPCEYNPTIGTYDIHWSLWWSDLFHTLSLVGIFSLILVGSFLLINDIAKEERVGTLNFIRLAPQTAFNILFGKLLGVPILLYLGLLIALPFHLITAINAGISGSSLLGYYFILIANSIFFYSISLLFGLITKPLGGFQPWLAAGFLLIYLMGVTAVSEQLNSEINNLFFGFCLILSPVVSLPQLILTGNAADRLTWLNKSWDEYQWFGLSLAYLKNLYLVMFLNSAFWTYWSWQSITRYFHKPTTTILAKLHSYLIVIGTELLLLGFVASSAYSRAYSSMEKTNIFMYMFLNLVLFVFLIMALNPQRQTLLDWSEYQNHTKSKRFSMLLDLLWGEKSPSILALVVNIALGAIILGISFPFWVSNSNLDIAYGSLILNSSILFLYGAIAGLIMLARIKHNGVVAIATISSLIVFPPIILTMLSVDPYKHPLAWIFTAFHWFSYDRITFNTILLGFLFQILIGGVMCFSMRRILKQAGESQALLKSATK